MPLAPTPETTRAFASAADFETWLSKHHASASELWLQFFKKGSGVATVTYKEAVDVALAWGWIDGIAKSLDAQAYVQRFTPRGKKSIWSKINVKNVARLIDADRMTPHGMAHVEAAKADGRWAAAYDSPKNMDVAGELLRAIEASPRRARRWRSSIDRAARDGFPLREPQDGGRSRQAHPRRRRHARGRSRPVRTDRRGEVSTEAHLREEVRPEGDSREEELPRSRCGTVSPPLDGGAAPA